MMCEDKEPKAPETTQQKPTEEPKERTPEENREISEKVAKGEPTEADDG